jgi:hypothetical protein
MRSRFFLRICFQFCLIFILWGQGSSKRFASNSACYLVWFFQRICFQFCLLFIICGQGSLRDCVLCIIFWPGLTGPVVDRRTCEPVFWPPEAAEAASWGPCGWAQSWPLRGYRSSGTWSSLAFQSCQILIIFSSSANWPMYCTQSCPMQRTNTEIWKKYSQKSNRAATVPISTFLCLWAIYIFPPSICLFCCRKHVDRSWEYINPSQTH